MFVVVVVVVFYRSGFIRSPEITVTDFYHHNLILYNKTLDLSKDL